MGGQDAPYLDINPPKGLMDYEETRTKKYIMSHASLSTEIANIIVQGTPGALTGLVGELRGRKGNVSDEENDTIRRSRLMFRMGPKYGSNFMM
jgi:hypothetical protein